MNYSGRIHVFIGPMFAGKSSELIRNINISKSIDKKCLVIKHEKDTRTNLKVSSHDELTIDAISVQNLMDVKETYTKLEEIDVIGIDEGQFFSDLVEFCEEMANKGKEVFVSGLDGDFERKEFPNRQISKLIPKAESCVKLTAMCNYCKKNEAAFSSRIVNEKSVLLIGGKDEYKASCRKCHHDNLNK